jgi:hypothetical protein
MEETEPKSVEERPVPKVGTPWLVPVVLIVTLIAGIIWSVSVSADNQKTAEINSFLATRCGLSSEGIATLKDSEGVLMTGPNTVSIDRKMTAVRGSYSDGTYYLYDANTNEQICFVTVQENLF